MKARKFWKKALRVRYLVALLIVICLGVVLTVYLTVGLDANTIKIDDNVAYNLEGFKDFSNQAEPVYKKDTTKTWWIDSFDTGLSDSQASYTEKNGTWHFANVSTNQKFKEGSRMAYNNDTKTWWLVYGDEDFDSEDKDLKLAYENVEFEVKSNMWYITDLDTKIKTDMESSKIVGENNDYIMFLDEITTIVTVCTKNSLVRNGDKNNPNDYAIKYESAKSNGVNDKKANLLIHYESTNLANLNNSDIDTYTKSVSYYNELTGDSDKHYEIKTENNKVIIYYTVGNFSSPTAYFPKKLYATRYEPAKCLYYDEDGNFDEAGYEAAVKEYEEVYLESVGSVYNTFEERFMGSVQIMSRTQLNNSKDKHLVYRTNEIAVYSQLALEYLLDVVFPELENDGLEIPSLDKEELFEQARKDAKSSGSKKTVKWTIRGVPSELINPHGEYYNKYFNVEGSPLTNNPFLINTFYSNVVLGYYKYYGENASTPIPYYQSTISAGIAATTMYKYFYGKEQTLYNDKYPVFEEIDGELVPVVSSGFVQRDEEGNAVRDEEGNLVKQLYSLDLVKKDNSLFADNEAGLAVFKIAIQFELTNNGLQITIPREYIVDSGNVKEKLSQDDDMYKMINGDYVITTTQICPYITEVDDTQEGYMIVPDGSGAIIEFNNNKTSTVSAPYYGKDRAYVAPMKQEEGAQLLLGMYAFVTTTKGSEKGIVAALNKGGGQLALTAGVNTGANKNYAFLTATIRSTEIIYTGTVAEPKQFTKFDKTLSPSDISIDYLILGKDELDYSTIAKKYQKYLIDKSGGELQLNDNTDTNLTDLTFLGSFEKYSLLLGIKYMTEDSLTTFDQAKDIINELEDNKVNNLSVSYKGWTSENLEYEVGGSLKVASVLGKTASMQSFYKFCVEKNIAFYPELSIATAKGYDYMLGSTRYSARGVGNTEAIEYQYDLSTGRPDKKLKSTYVISPLYYQSITEKLMSDYQKLNIWKNKTENGGFYLTDIGNKWSGNYRKGRQVYGGDAVLYQQQVLDILSENGKIKIEAPCDYAFKYVDVATSVPVTSKMFAIYDETIPFYQLVISGLFDYTTEYINGMSNKSTQWYFTKVLETGSNVSFLISAEDPSILLETDYTQYYQSYYHNWKDTIIDFNTRINELGIHQSVLTSYKSVNGLSEVVYTNKTNGSKLVLIVNSTDSSKTYTDGTIVPGYSYIVG